MKWELGFSDVVQKARLRQTPPVAEPKTELQGEGGGQAGDQEGMTVCGVIIVPNDIEPGPDVSFFDSLQDKVGPHRKSRLTHQVVICSIIHHQCNDCTCVSSTRLGRD